MLTLLPGLGALGHPVGAALAAAGMLLAAYGPSDRLLRRGALFLVLSCAFGGVLVLVSLARGSSAGAGGLLGPSLGMRGILIAAALSYGALSLVLGRQFAKTQAGGGLCPLTLTKGEKTLRLLALIDTGNTLRDPLTGEGVVVLDCGRAGALVPELAGVPAQAFQRPVELLARFAGEEPDLRLLPYQAVGGALRPAAGGAGGRGRLGRAAPAPVPVRPLPDPAFRRRGLPRPGGRRTSIGGRL